MNLYSDNNPANARWLANLAAAGRIPPGNVDDRDIRTVPPADLDGYTQVHLFAGIAGWPHALDLAGWPRDRPVWTFSCPCQPFSVAGKRKGTEDDRHVWPAVRSLIAALRPPECLGEQVGSPLGREWLARVRTDLAALGYEVCAADLPAASVGAPHRRQRLYFAARRVGNTDRARRERERPRRHRSQGAAEPPSPASGLGNPPGRRPPRAPQTRPQPQLAARRPSPTSRLGDLNPWADAEPLHCADNTQRRAQPGIHPLAHGLPPGLERTRRKTLLTGYGNAIVAPLAAQFIAAYTEAAEHPLS